MERENLLRQLREAGERNRQRAFPFASGDKFAHGYSMYVGTLLAIISSEIGVRVPELMQAYGSVIPVPVSTVSLGDVLGELAWADA